MMTIMEINAAQLSDAGILTLFGMTVVFSVLVLLTLVFKSLPRIIELRIRKQLKKEGIDVSKENLSMEADLNAVLAVAVYLYMSELHDEESRNITIRKISRDYSPWSSKIYGLNLWN